MHDQAIGTALAALRSALAQLAEAGIYTHHVEEDTMSTIRKSYSFNQQVLELNPGESVAKVRAVDPTTPVSRLADEMPAIRDQVRNACAPAIKRAKEQTGGTYTVETGDLSTSGGGYWVIGIVTRVE